MMKDVPVYDGTMTPHKLWYASPPARWSEGLPIGTGRIAAMVMGTVKRDRIALNHEWLWRGDHRRRDNEVRAGLLPGVRELLLAGRYEEGTRAGNEAFGGGGGISGTPNRVDPYQPAGDLYLEFNHDVDADYRRELDLETAQVTVGYQASGRRFTREYLAHLVEDLILVRVSAEGRPFDVAVWLDRLFDPGCALDLSAASDRLDMSGRFASGVEFAVRAALRTRGGASRAAGRRIEITGTEELIVAVDIGTSAQGRRAADEAARCAVPTDAWEEVVRRHRAEHARHYGGLSLEIDAPVPSVPTDERIRAYRAGADDPGFVLTYFNFGRYLLCASSARASLPPNLQGKWNEDLDPPWQADYHHDVNLQMCYWPAEPGHLHAYTDALFAHLERFVPHARKAARDLYGCDGIWFPIQTDPWGRSTPESFGWAVWIGAAPWLAQHLWWHWEYGQDREFLRSRCYPFLKEAAAFYESYLVKDPRGTWQIVPSQSPENRFTASGERFPVSLCVSATMDVQLAWDLLTHAIRASEILAVDEERRARWKEIVGNLPRIGIGSHGELLEWNAEMEEAEPGHRHLSHLFGLYPGEQLDPERTPELWKAARRSLERRLAHAGGHTGWSRAWTACCFARLGDGDLALEHLKALVVDFSTSTLLDLHPPRIFQIDGNLGGTAAVLEMLLQSYGEELHLLPALPSAWPSGSIRGIRGRGGYTVGMRWSHGRLDEAEVVCAVARECVVRSSAGALRVRDGQGRAVEARVSGERTMFPVRAGERYRLIPAG